MGNDEFYKFYCPRCKNLASVHETISRRNYATQALRTPYFLCGECCLIFISKQLVKMVVNEWWRRNRLKRVAPLKYFYDKSTKYLYGIVLDYHKGIGYKLARFKKIQPRH